MYRNIMDMSILEWLENLKNSIIYLRNLIDLRNT